MIKDIEQIIGRSIKGLKNSDIDSISLESGKVNFLMNKDRLKNNWSYDIENNNLTVKNNNFKADFLFEVDTLVHIAKTWRKLKNKALPELKKEINTKPQKVIKKATNRQRPAINRKLYTVKNSFMWSSYINM